MNGGDRQRRSAVERFLQHEEDLSPELRRHHEKRKAHGTAGLQPRTRFAQPFDGINEGIDADAGSLAEDRVRIEQSVDEEIVAPRRVSQERTIRWS